MSDTLNHAALLKLSKELRRPLYTLEVLGKNDPFTAGVPARAAAAKWFAKLWRRFNIQPGAHLRRIHYVLISQKPGSVLMPDGTPYLNLDRPCFDTLNKASLDARYLGLIQADWLVDRRNAEPTIFREDIDEDDGCITAETGGVIGSDEPLAISVPRLTVTPPTMAQPYHVEIWCEKSTMNDILMPLGEQYGINVITGAGELSLTRCVELVERANTSEKPVRILYLSDFDPAGASMPVAVARKIEHELHVRGHDLDVQVRPIVLTHAQCRQYRLPRTPIKDTEKRAAKFEERFGEGATELDALEALHPGELRRILLKEIRRYHDGDLNNRIEVAASTVQAEIDDITEAVHRRHAKALAELEAERRKVAEAIDRLAEKAEPILLKIEEDLEAEAPDADAFDWPEPKEGNEDDDPLFDSTRDYLDQIDRYKYHQGKPTESVRKPYEFSKATCAVCGETFEATSRNASMTCSDVCREQQRRDKVAAAKPLAKCVVCKKPFNSIRGAETCSDKCRKTLRRKRGSG
jgi:predicted nucleic acid-binding Zn ribbon protein